MIDNLFNLIFRCRHRHLSRPLTPKPGLATYMRCLDCGRAFAYDAREMKLGKVLIESATSAASDIAVRQAP